MYKHGHYKGDKASATYTSWTNMKNRCFHTTDKYYKYYGGRGITVCERWLQFENFLADMGERPEGKTLDRKDNDGNYEPGNCRWATRQEQACNRRTKTAEVDGIVKPILEWCRIFNVPYDTLVYRLKIGFSIKEALTKGMYVRSKQVIDETKLLNFE